MLEKLRLPCQVECSDCHRAISGWVALDDMLQVCDSDGFLIAGCTPPRIVCDPCASQQDMPTRGDQLVTEDLQDPGCLSQAADTVTCGLAPSNPAPSPPEDPFKSVKRPPDRLFWKPAPPGVFIARRLTPADLEMIRRDYPDYCRACEREAELNAEDGEGVSKEDWDKEPETYRAECNKTCHRLTIMRKGSVYEFALYGVYVCSRCGYAWPPDCPP